MRPLYVKSQNMPTALIIFLLVAFNGVVTAALTLNVNPYNNTLSLSGYDTGKFLHGVDFEPPRTGADFSDPGISSTVFNASWGVSFNPSVSGGGSPSLEVDDFLSFALNSLLTTTLIEGSLALNEQSSFTIRAVRYDTPSLSYKLDQVAVGVSLISDDEELEVTFSGTDTFIEYNFSEQSESIFESSLSNTEFTSFNGSGFSAIQINTIPEPSSFLLFGLGSIILLAQHRRTIRKASNPVDSPSSEHGNFQG